MTEYVEVTIEQANTPESHKRGCEPSREKRAKIYMSHLVVERIDIAVNQESGTYLQAEIARRDRWRDSPAPPNDHIKERTAGNRQTSRVKLGVTERRHLAVQRVLFGRKLGKPLNQTVVLYRIPGTTGAAELCVIGIHAQTRRADPFGISRGCLNRLLAWYSNELHKAGILHAIVGDANNGKASWAAQFPHLKIAHHHGVDWILVSPEVKVLGGNVYDLPRVSDHEFVAARLAVPVTTTPTKRLPKP